MPASNKGSKSAALGQRSQKIKLCVGVKLSANQYIDQARTTPQRHKDTKPLKYRPNASRLRGFARVQYTPRSRGPLQYSLSSQNSLSYTRPDNLNCPHDSDSRAPFISGNPAADRGRRAAIYTDNPAPAPCRIRPWPQRAAAGWCKARSPQGSASWLRPGRP